LFGEFSPSYYIAHTAWSATIGTVLEREREEKEKGGKLRRLE